ncbi:MAG: twin-arginine translocation signal domain-containing protein, partial [Candidatus Binatia bacterium]
MSKREKKSASAAALNSVSRRQFIKLAGASAAAVGALSWSRA